MKRQNGITLVALVITIIVLLILAGVSISLVVGNNGILSQASNAVVKNKEAQAKEEVAMAWASVGTQFWTDLSTNSSTTQDGYFTKAKLDPYLTNGSLVEDPTYSDGVYTVKYQSGGTTYLINIDGYGNTTVAGSTDSNIISAASAVLSPTSYYGKTVNYSANGITDWRILYSDGSHFFIIASNYLPIAKVPTNSGMTTSGTYVAFWDTAPATLDTSNQQLALFKATGYTLNGEKSNSKCVAKLLNTEIWKDFKNSTYADHAIGGPTIEMWVASWNELYPTETIRCGVGPSPNGYMIAVGDAEYACYMDLSGLEGYNNPLYFPYHTKQVDTNAYWFASPSGFSWLDVMDANRTGYVSSFYHDNRDVGQNQSGLRPVVCLKSSVILTPGTTYDFDLHTN